MKIREQLRDLTFQKKMFSYFYLVFAVLVLSALILAFFTTNEFDGLMMLVYAALFGIGMCLCYCSVVLCKIQIIEKGSSPNAQTKVKWMENDKWEKAYLTALGVQAILGLILIWFGCLLFTINFFFRIIPEVDGLIIFVMCSFLGFLATFPFLKKTGIWEQLMRNVI